MEQKESKNFTIIFPQHLQQGFIKIPSIGFSIPSNGPFLFDLGFPRNHLSIKKEFAKPLRPFYFRWEVLLKQH